MDCTPVPTADLLSCDMVPPPDAESTHNGDNFNDWGDFVDSEDEFDIETVSEDVNLYPRGMCYPIRIGEVMAGRYRIIHKLGHGSFSTVWMAYDLAEEKDVALKILMLGDSDDREYHMQREIVRAVRDTTYLVVYRSTFFLHSPHGHHRVLVFPLLGPNLRDHPPREPPTTRMSFAIQLLQALKNLHDGEIVHGGKPTQQLTTVSPICIPLEEASRTNATCRFKQGQYIIQSSCFRQLQHS